MGLNHAQREENGVNIFANIFHYFKMAASSREHIFASGDLAAMKECKIITLKYTGKACRLYLLYSSASEDIIL